jgi:hypothetical protein
MKTFETINLDTAILSENLIEFGAFFAQEAII